MTGRLTRTALAVAAGGACLLGGVSACGAGPGPVDATATPTAASSAASSAGRSGPSRASRPSPAPAHPDTAPARESAVVERVVDGDTIVVRRSVAPGTQGGPGAQGGSGDGSEKVRLGLVDAPESTNRHDCWGAESSRWMHDALPAGTAVTLGAVEKQPDRDRYGRLLRMVVLPDGRDVSEESVRAGMARDYRSARPGPGLDRVLAAESEARGAGRGLWGACPQP